MILGVDIGNTTIYFGVIENDEVLKSFRITTKKDITEEEYEIVIKNVLEENLEKDKVDGIIIASVVPEVTSELEQALTNVIGVKPVIAQRDVVTNLGADPENIKVVGTDIICNSVGAKIKYKLPVIIFDMGTATTCMVVDEQGIFRGGMVCPGLKTSVNALISNASQLSNFPLGNPKNMIGMDPPECINAGVIYGHSSMINGLKTRIEKETGSKYTVVLTGGNSDYVKDYIDKDIIVDKNLIFYGLNELYKNI